MTLAFLSNISGPEILIIFLFIVLPSVCWLKAVITDANSGSVTWVLVDILQVALRRVDNNCNQVQPIWQ